LLFFSEVLSHIAEKQQFSVQSAGKLITASYMKREHIPLPHKHSPTHAVLEIMLRDFV
jgi:hypothetical protein